MASRKANLITKIQLRRNICGAPLLTGLAFKRIEQLEQIWSRTIEDFPKPTKKERRKEAFRRGAQRAQENPIPKAFEPSSVDISTTRSTLLWFVDFYRSRGDDSSSDEVATALELLFDPAEE